MKPICKLSLFVGLLLAVAGLASPAVAKDKSEDELIADLSSRNADKVTESLLQLERKYPNSTKAFPTMKTLLKDPRPTVRRKAGRVLGVLHAEVDTDNLHDICVMLKASDPKEQMDALKSLRGLKAESTVPEIVPLLKSPNPNVVRD